MNQSEKQHGRTSHVRLHHLARSVFWLAVTAAGFALVMHYVNGYVSEPSMGALVGLIAGMWLRDALTNYCDHATGILFPGSYSND